MNPRSLTANPRGYDRGAARANELVADLATGRVNPEEFGVAVLTHLGGRLDAASQGFVGTLAERLAELVAERGAGGVEA